MTATTAVYEVKPYESVQDLICWLIHKFIASKGGDFHDLLCEANAAFVKARDTYRPERKVKFSTWVACLVWRYLLTFSRREAIHHRREPAMEDLDRLRHQRSFLTDLTDGMSSDAKQVIDLALDDELALASVRGPGEAKRNRLINLLSDLGWAGKRIAESFREVREALNS